MTSQKLPSKPTNLILSNCDIVIGNQHFNKLEISPLYEEKIKNTAKD